MKDCLGVYELLVVMLKLELELIVSEEAQQGQRGVRAWGRRTATPGE